MHNTGQNTGTYELIKPKDFLLGKATSKESLLKPITRVITFTGLFIFLLLHLNTFRDDKELYPSETDFRKFSIRPEDNKYPFTYVVKLLSFRAIADELFSIFEFTIYFFKKKKLFWQNYALVILNLTTNGLNVVMIDNGKVEFIFATLILNFLMTGALHFNIDEFYATYISQGFYINYYLSIFEIFFYLKIFGVYSSFYLGLFFLMFLSVMGIVGVLYSIFKVLGKTHFGDFYGNFFLIF